MRKLSLLHKFLGKYVQLAEPLAKAVLLIEDVKDEFRSYDHI